MSPFLAPTITTLQNGMRVATITDKHAPAVTALVLIGVGSSYETKEENGLSHFLEHMCFKGTTSRPSAKAITEEIESLGAVTNAFTDREYTGYFIKGNPAHTETFVDILADIYQHSLFPQTEVQKEKGVIVEEINMYEDMPQQKVADVLFSALYPAHAAGRSILGTKKTVNSFAQKDFLSYKNRYYTGENTVLVFSGNITAKKATALAESYFAAVPKGKKNKRPAVVQDQQSPRTTLSTKSTDQAHFILGFRSLPLGHKDLTIVKLISTIMGRGMSSRLSLIVREELGAAYYVGAHQESYVDHGIFAIAAGIDKARLGEILDRVVRECNRAIAEAVSEKELAKAKEYAIGTFRLGLELSDSVAEFYGTQLVLRQKIRTPEEVIAKIRQVQPADIRRVAATLFRPERATLALVGPFTDIKKNAAALRRLAVGL